MNGMDILGYLAGILTACTLVPQIIDYLKTGDVPVKWGMLFFFFSGMTAWLAYGILANSLPMMISNGFAVAAAAVQIGIKLSRERGAKKKE